MSDVDRYGVFARFWAGNSPRHLPLLHLATEEEVNDSLGVLCEILEDTSSVDVDLHALLRAENWRPQLVGAVVVALGWGSESHCDDIWQILKTGSWVSPQLAVVVSLIGPDFKERAREVVGTLLSSELDRARELPQFPETGPDEEDPVPSPERLAEMATRHVERGPGSRREESAKTLSALVELLGTDDQWVHENLEKEKLEAVLKFDADNGGMIAAQWKERLVRRTERLGLCRRR